MIEILIALLSSATTILCVVLQQKVKNRAQKKSLIDVLAAENVHEIKLHIRNKDAPFKFTDEASGNHKNTFVVSVECAKEFSKHNKNVIDRLVCEIERAINV
jgi:hypothetical protein